MKLEKAWEIVNKISQTDKAKFEEKFGVVILIIPAPIPCNTQKKLHDYFERAKVFKGDIQAFTEKRPFWDYFVCASLESGKYVAY